MRALCSLVGLIMWVFGIILANGVLSTVIAFFIPFWAWYLAIEHLARHFGLL